MDKGQQEGRSDWGWLGIRKAVRDQIMSGLEGQHTEFGCFSKASEKALGRFEACFHRTKSHTLLSAIAPHGLTHTHAVLVLRTPSQLPAQEGPWLSCTELCEMQISEPACPRAQDIVLQSKETFSSFLSPCPRLMLLPYLLLVEMVSHPKGEERPQAPPFFFPARSSHRAPASRASGLF